MISWGESAEPLTGANKITGLPSSPVSRQPRGFQHLHLITSLSTLLLNEIQSRRSSTSRALRSPKPANTGLRDGARCKPE